TEGVEPAPPGRPNQFRYGRIAASGRYVAVVWHNGRGLHLFEADTGEVAQRIERPGREIITLLGAPNGNRIVTVEKDRPERPGRGGRADRPKGDARGGGRPPELNSHVNLWDPEQPEAPIKALDTPAPRTDPQQGGPSRLPPLVAISADLADPVVAVARMFEP